MDTEYELHGPKYEAIQNSPVAIHHEAMAASSLDDIIPHEVHSPSKTHSINLYVRVLRVRFKKHVGTYFIAY